MPALALEVCLQEERVSAQVWVPCRPALAPVGVSSGPARVWALARVLELVPCPRERVPGPALGPEQVLGWGPYPQERVPALVRVPEREQAWEQGPARVWEPV